MIRLIPILLTVCATALALSGCLRTPMNNPSSYRAISDTNVSRSDAFTYCKRQSLFAQAPSTPDTGPKRYVINKGIGNTYYANEAPTPPGAAGAFLQGFASTFAAVTAQRNALERCMLQLGYIEAVANLNPLTNQSDEAICMAAAASWSTGKKDIWVDEAKRRGFTHEFCTQLLSLTTPVAGSTKTNKVEGLASWEPSKLCRHAYVGNKWETRSQYIRYVTEAKRRGYTPESCAKFLGLTTPVASSSGKLVQKGGYLARIGQVDPTIPTSPGGDTNEGRAKLALERGKKFLVKRKMCESAQASEDMKASFMQSISKDELSKFLKSGQDCSIF